MSLDEFAGHLLAQWQLNDIKPKGPMVAITQPNEQNEQRAMMKRMVMELGPLSFHRFMDGKTVKVKIL